MLSRTPYRVAALLLAVSPLVAPLAAQATLDARVRAAAEGIMAADLMRDVSFIASDALKGRSTPSPGLDTAAAYVVQRLTQLGVTPMGDGGSYLQHYDVVSSTLDTVGTSVSSGTVRMRWGEEFVVMSFLVPGDVRGDVVYVGNGLRAPKRGIDAYAGLDVRGKWLLVHSGSRRPSAALSGRLGTYGVDYTTVQDEARSRGAAGLLVIASAADEMAWNELRAQSPRSRELSPPVGRAYASFPIPVVMLRRAAVGALLAGARTSAAEVLAADSLETTPASFPLARRDLLVHLAGTSEHRRAYNVVGLVEGADPVVRREWITVSTHLDGAVGRAVTPSGDSIYNAADDNGTGSAGNLSIARALLSGPRPKRSVLLVWDSGEESGLWGTRFLAYGPLAKQVVAHFTVDMIGRTKAPGTNIEGQAELSGPGEVFVSGPGVLSTVLDSALSAVSRDYGFVHFDRRYEDPKHEFFYPRTDAAPYIEQGIPYMEFFTGLHEDYHAPTDEVWKLDPVKFEAVTRAVYVTLWTVANGRLRPRIDKPVPPVLWFMRPR